MTFPNIRLDAPYSHPAVATFLKRINDLRFPALLDVMFLKYWVLSTGYCIPRYNLTMPDDAPQFPPQSQQIDDGAPRGPIVVGALVVLLVLGALILAGRSARSTAQSSTDPYVKNLQLSEFKLSQAENFVGGNVTYLEGKVKNAGNKTVTSGQLRVVFKNSLDEVTQAENLALMVITAREPYIDTADLRSAPLKPGDTRDFRLTFEHVTADWSGAMPDVSVQSVTTQ
jgi:hypothetical protein